MWDHFPSSGELTVTQLEGILRTLPFELTLLMQPIRIVFFGIHTVPFPSPLTALGHSVYDCHPPKDVPMVKAHREAAQRGKRFGLDLKPSKNGKKARVRYLAVRDREGAYLGTLEVVEELS